MTELKFSKGLPKEEVFRKIQVYLESQRMRVMSADHARPWGGFFVIDETQAEHFTSHFFPDVDPEGLKIGGRLSPKILVVQPSRRLSWQYHHRRAEIWKLVAGEAGLVTSQTDTEGPVIKLKIGEVIRLAKGQRHRLVGLEDWGMIAEIWQHTDTANPSDEEDIVRVQDDFGR